MAKSSPLDAKLARLAQIEAGTPSAEDIFELRAAIQGTNHILAAKAASLAGELGVSELVPDLAAALGRFMEKGGKADKGCRAKTAIVEALSILDYGDPDVFLRGIRHVQMEPVYGGRADAAAGLRGRCAIALAQLAIPEAVYEICDLLADPEKEARGNAVSALGLLATEASELLLRMKASSGDEPEVIETCFSVLMKMAPERSIPFVARFLGHANPAMVEAAAMALSESRTIDAFNILLEAWQQHLDPSYRKMLLLPFALTRLDEAVAFLVDLVENAGITIACEAVKCLGAVYQDDQHLRKQVKHAVTNRAEESILKAYDKAFL